MLINNKQNCVPSNYCIMSIDNKIKKKNIQSISVVENYGKSTEKNIIQSVCTFSSLVEKILTYGNVFTLLRL